MALIAISLHLVLVVGLKDVFLVVAGEALPLVSNPDLDSAFIVGVTHLDVTKNDDLRLTWREFDRV